MNERWTSYLLSQQAAFIDLLYSDESVCDDILHDIEVKPGHSLFVSLVGSPSSGIRICLLYASILARL